MRMKTSKTARYATLGLALICLVAAASGCKSEEQIQQQVQQKEEEAVYVDLRSTITVSGEGKVMLAPDKATVYFTIRSQGKEATDAQQQNTELTTAVLEAIEAAGVPQADINTGSVSVSERYNYDKTPPVIEGYEATCELTVVIRKTENVGEVISQAVAAGASNVRGPEYAVTNASAAYVEALATAMADAKAKAETLATGAGVRLIPLPVSIQEQSSNSDVAPLETRQEEPMAAPEAMADVTAMPISISDLEVVARISAVYEIK